MRLRTRDWLLAVLLLTALVGFGVLVERSGLWRYLQDRQALEAFVERLGPWGPALIVVVEIAQVLLVTVPGQFIGLAAGYLYGVFWGTVYVLVGLLIGTTLAMWLGRHLGRPLVERLASPELVERIDRYARERGPLALFLIFLLPFMPDDVTCFVAGLTPLRLGELVLLAMVGRTPGVIVSVWIGARAEALGWREIGLLTLAGVALSLLFARYQQRIEALMYRLLDALTPPWRR